MKKQTAVRDAIGTFAPKFAELNDDVLFGEVWAREDKLSLRDRSVITVTALMTKGIFDNSLKYHMINAKNNGVTAEEMYEIITYRIVHKKWICGIFYCIIFKWAFKENIRPISFYEKHGYIKGKEEYLGKTYLAYRIRFNKKIDEVKNV